MSVIFLIIPVAGVLGFIFAGIFLAAVLIRGRPF
jgi:hypothetical protein